MRFVARQPVFDAGMQIFGYELLFRSGLHEIAQFTNPDDASRMTMDTSLAVGFDKLCGGRKAFVNCTREILTSGAVEVLPAGTMILEVLEDVPADTAVLEGCLRLKRQGYSIALDDVVSPRRVEPFLGVADFVKVDFRKTSKAGRAELAKLYASRGIAMLAEKVETHEEHLAAAALGYKYFQGFFFQRPQILGAREIPALKVNYTRLLAAAQQPEVDFAGIEEIIKSEPSLCYRLLRYLNSPLFAFTNRITSVRHALTLVGEQEIRKWISVAALVSVGVDKPGDLVMWALVRARFCELLGMRAFGRQPGMFFLGLISAMPVLLDLPLEFIITRLPVLPEIQTALLGGRNRYRQAYELVLAYEAGQWETCSALAKSVNVIESHVTACYLGAVEWASRLQQSEAAWPSAPVESQAPEFRPSL